MRLLFRTVGRRVSLVHLCEGGTVILHEALSANFNIVFAAHRAAPRRFSLGVVITRAGVTPRAAFTRLIVRGASLTAIAARTHPRTERIYRAKIRRSARELRTFATFFPTRSEISNRASTFNRSELYSRRLNWTDRPTIFTVDENARCVACCRSDRR